MKSPSEILLAAAVLGVCLGTAPACAKPAAQSRSAGAREQHRAHPAARGEDNDMGLRVVRTLPHDAKAFTQGLLFYDGKFYESTGLHGRSSLRRVDPESGVVERKVDLPADVFAEGLARVGGSLIQLTWQEGRAFVWNLTTMRKEKEFSYEGEGWGLCFDGHHLIMSDGSDTLAVRDPETFAKLGQVAVRRAGKPVSRLNELECVDGVVYANVWQDNHIARIDPRTGEVTGWIDAAGLLSPDEQRQADVLNGIVYLPTTGHLVLTGKLWPKAFEVELVPASSSAM